MPRKTQVSPRITDPVYYRMTVSNLMRRFRRFRNSPETLEPGRMTWERVLVAVAHPDDETFCSGLICELVSGGADVKVLCLTRGEGGPTGGLERAQLGEAREAEMQSSCNVLGVHELNFLDHIDPEAVRSTISAPKVSVSDLAAQMEEYLSDVDLVISHGSNGEYWHPAHLLVFDAVKKAMACRNGNLDWLTFQARQTDHRIPRLVNWDDDADFQIDVSQHQPVREQALSCHQSQLALFGRFAGDDYRGFIRKTKLESYRWRNRKVSAKKALS